MPSLVFSLCLSLSLFFCISEQSKENVIKKQEETSFLFLLGSKLISRFHELSILFILEASRFAKNQHDARHPPVKSSPLHVCHSQGQEHLVRLWISIADFNDFERQEKEAFHVNSDRSVLFLQMEAT